MQFAASYPGKVAGLVLIEPTLRQALVGRMGQVARLRPLVVPAVWLIRALNAVGVHRRRLKPLDLEELDRRTRAAISAGGAAGALLRWYASPWLDLRTTASAAYLEGLVAMSSRPPDLSAIKAPVLALLSTAGTFSDPTITAELLARVPMCRVVRLEAQHWIPTEQPEAMRRAIEEWCIRLCSTGLAGCG